MAGFFYKGILLQQRKEPALSRDLREFLNADTMGLRMDCPPVENPDKLTPGEIIHLARLANIVDERDGIPLADKLTAACTRNTRLVIVDAIDDEPYISSQLNPVLKNVQLAADGLSFCQRACGAAQAYFAVYKNLTDLDIRIPKHIGDYSIVRLHGRYPAEYQASQDYAQEEDILVVGSGAVLHLARAILFRKPQTTAFITVAGDCVGNPTNLEVSLGMTVTQALERCGLIDDPHRVVVGGSMTGISVIDTDRTLVTPTTRAILAFRQDLKTLGLSCIGCARCVHVCPEGLNPFFLYKSIQEHRYDVFRGLDAQMCVGCGTCSYMCPAKLDLSEAIYQAAASFRPKVAAMRSTAALDKKRDEADYQRFLDDYRLNKAIMAHRLVRWKLTRQFRSSCKEAMAARKTAYKAADQALRQAKQVRLAAERAADAALAAEKQKMDAVFSMAARDVAQKEKALERITRDARKTLKAARLSANTAQAAARQNTLAVLREQQRLADTVISLVQKKMKRLEKNASPDMLSKIRRERDSVITRAGERRAVECRQAQQCAVRSIEHARAAWNHAVELCHKQVSDAGEALNAAKASAEIQKEAAMKEYAGAQSVYAGAKQAAEDAFALAQKEILLQKAKADEVWIQATKDSRPAAVETLREADLALRQAQEAALASARASAEADAAVTARAMRPSDIRPPVHLTRGEEELLRGRRLLALEPAPAEASTAAENAKKLLLNWIREDPPPVHAAVGAQSGEEVLS